MYKRLPQDKIDLIKKEQQSDRLFINLYDAIGAVGLDIDDITPEEIWQEASEQVHTIANSPQPIFNVDSLHTSLCHKYIDYANENGEIQHRTQAAAKNTAFLVELVILYQLTVCKRDWDNHPYLNFCHTIYTHINTNPIFKDILPKIEATNDKYEKVYNSEIPEHDYMPQIVKEDSIIKEAVQISLDCAQYLSPNYTLQWLKDFWVAFIQSQYKEQLIEELQSQSKYTTIYHIIGMLKKQKVYNAEQIQLANTSKLAKPSKESIRRYISDGVNDNTTNYTKFVIQYVKENPPK